MGEATRRRRRSKSKTNGKLALVIVVLVRGSALWILRIQTSRLGRVLQKLSRYRRPPSSCLNSILLGEKALGNTTHSRFHGDICGYIGILMHQHLVERELIIFTLQIHFVSLYCLPSQLKRHRVSLANGIALVFFKTHF